MAIREKAKDTYDYLANQFPTRKPRVKRTPTVTEGPIERAKMKLTENIGGGPTGRTEPPITYQNPIDRAGKTASNLLKGNVSFPKTAEPDPYSNAMFLNRTIGPNSPIRKGIRGVTDAAKSLFRLPYADFPTIGGPQEEVAPGGTPYRSDVPLGPENAPQQPATATPGAPVQEAEYKPDMNKPFWWLDDRLGEQRPIQLIRGTNVTWQSPVDGKEYATAREAFEGQTTEQRITTETQAAEHQRGMELEALKGQYGIAKAQATPRKRFEIDQDTLSPTDQPNVLDTFEGGIYPGGVPAQAQEAIGGALNEAQMILSQDVGVGASALRGMTAAKRKMVLDRMFKMDRAKGLKILDKLSKSATE